MEIYVDATTLIALGSVGRIDLLSNFNGALTIPATVVSEVTSEPARRLLRERLVDGAVLKGEQSDDGRAALRRTETVSADHLDAARDVLDETEINGDVEIVASVLEAVDDGEPVAVVSDDRRVRTVADDFSATVTGTIGVVVRAAHEGMAPDEAKSIVREIDSRGLHLTGELRDSAFDLIDDAAEENDE